MSEIKKLVCADFTAHAVNVDNDVLFFEDKPVIDTVKNALPDDLKDKTILSLNWLNDESNQCFFVLSDSSTWVFENTEENYNKWVKPYVDLWQAEKDRLEKEEQEEQAEYNKFENRQARALTTLNTEFEQAKTDAHLTSSLGFEIDANQTANENITGLLVTIGDGTTQFCDYNNVFHEVNKADLETMQTEIIQNAQYLYQQKWSYRSQIEECTDGDALDEILAQIEFRYKDFTQ